MLQPQQCWGWKSPSHPTVGNHRSFGGYGLYLGSKLAASFSRKHPASVLLVQVPLVRCLWLSKRSPCTAHKGRVQAARKRTKLPYTITCTLSTPSTETCSELELITGYIWIVYPFDQSTKSSDFQFQGSIVRAATSKTHKSTLDVALLPFSPKNLKTPET